MRMTDFVAGAYAAFALCSLVEAEWLNAGFGVVVTILLLAQASAGRSAR
jgi:hypothetical protein